MLNDPLLRQIVFPLIFLGGSLLLGLILEWLITRQLRRWVERTPWQSDDVIIASLRGMSLVWSVTVGAFVAVEVMALSPELTRLFEQIIQTIVILTITIVVARIIVGLVTAWLRTQRGNLPTSSLVLASIWLGVLMVGGLVIVQNIFGLSITPILTTLGVGGLAVALALQDTLANLFAGFYVIITRKIRLGDYIKLDTGQEGYVVDIAWRNATIRALSNNLVIVPNAKLASAIVTNYSVPERELAVQLNLGVSYVSDLRMVEQVTIEVGKAVMREVKGGIPEFEPFIRYNAFGDNLINFTVNLRAREFTDQYVIIHEFIKRLHMRYQEEGIGFPAFIHPPQINKGDGSVPLRENQDADRA